MDDNWLNGGIRVNDSTSEGEKNRVSNQYSARLTLTFSYICDTLLCERWNLMVSSAIEEFSSKMSNKKTVGGEAFLKFLKRVS